MKIIEYKKLVLGSLYERHSQSKEQKQLYKLNEDVLSSTIDVDKYPIDGNMLIAKTNFIVN